MLLGFLSVQQQWVSSTCSRRVPEPHAQDLARSAYVCEDEDANEVDDCIGALSRCAAPFAEVHVFCTTVCLGVQTTCVLPCQTGSPS